SVGGVAERARPSGTGGAGDRRAPAGRVAPGSGGAGDRRARGRGGPDAGPAGATAACLLPVPTAAPAVWAVAVGAVAARRAVVARSVRIVMAGLPRWTRKRGVVRRGGALGAAAAAR